MSTCPDHETLACFLEQRLDEPLHAEVAHHVAACEHCLDVVAVAGEVGASVAPADAPVQPDRRVPTPLPSPPRSPGPRAWPRALAAGLALTLMGAAGYTAVDHLSEYARTTAVRLASERLGVPVDVSRLEIALGAGLGSIGVRAFDLDLGPLGRMDTAELFFAPADLASANALPHHVRLVGPEFRWALGPGTTETPFAALGAAPTTEIVDAVLRVDRPDAPTIVIDQLHAIGRMRESQLQVQATGRVSSGTITVRGSLTPGEPARLDLTVGVRAVPTTDIPRLPEGLTGTATIAARVVGPPGGLRWSGRAHIADATLNAVTLGADLAGALHFDRALLGDLRNGTADIRATFRLGGTTWRIPRSVVVQGPLEARASLDGTDADQVRGRGILRVARAESRTLIARHPLIGFYGTPTGELSFSIRIAGTPERLRLTPNLLTPAVPPRSPAAANVRSSPR